MSDCAVCEQKTGDLGQPSRARWKGPDGDELCSMHFILKYGHGEKLVRIEDFEPPAEVKKPAPRNGRRRKPEGATSG